MKKILLVVLVLMFSFTCFAISSPTIERMVETNPIIPFELVTDTEEAVALNPIKDLFGERIAKKFHLDEVLDLEVQENWGIVEFKFISIYTEQDTVIAVFVAAEEEYTILFLEYENGTFAIDFSLVSIGSIRMYVVSDYER